MKTGTGDDDLLARRIAGEFDECPALRLTPTQAARLWALPLARVDTILRALADQGRLLRTPRGEFIRRVGCARCE